MLPAPFLHELATVAVSTFTVLLETSPLVCDGYDSSLETVDTMETSEIFSLFDDSEIIALSSGLFTLSRAASSISSPAALACCEGGELLKDCAALIPGEDDFGGTRDL